MPKADKALGEENEGHGFLNKNSANRPPVFFSHNLGLEMLKDSALRQLQAEFVVLVNFWSSNIFVNNSTSGLVLNFVHSNFPGGILRQCLRLVCTCAVRNCLECKEKMTPSSSASQNRQVMPSSSSQQTVEETNSSRVSFCLEFFLLLFWFSPSCDEGGSSGRASDFGPHE